MVLGLKRIELSDRPLFEKAFSSLKKPLADQAFPMIYIWDKLLNVRWKKINENICCFADFEGRTVIWGPIIGGSKLKETVDECFAILKELNKTQNNSLLYIPEELEPVFGQLKGYKAVHQSQDYVYEVSELISLKGEKFKSKRSMVNHFSSSYVSRVELYDESKHKKGCVDLLKRWKEDKKLGSNIAKVKFQFDTEVEISNNTIEFAAILGLKGIVVIVDGKVQGMTFGYAVNKQMCSVVIEKTNTRLKGISEFIFAKFLELCWKDFKFVNTQEDMGVSYLAQAKMSYHPCFLIKSFKVVKDGAG